LLAKGAAIQRERWLELTEKKLAKKIVCANPQRAAHDGETMTRNQPGVGTMTRSQPDPAKGEPGVTSFPENGASKTDTLTKAVLRSSSKTLKTVSKHNLPLPAPNQINATD
jgi:hypothetical protein